MHIYIYIYITTLYVYKTVFLRCFNSGPFSQIRLQMFCQKWSLVANQVTYAFTNYE